MCRHYDTTRIYCTRGTRRAGGAPQRELLRLRYSRKDGCDCDIVVEIARTNVCVSVLSTSCVPTNGYATAPGYCFFLPEGK